MPVEKYANPVVSIADPKSPKPFGRFSVATSVKSDSLILSITPARRLPKYAKPFALSITAVVKNLLFLELI